MPHIKDEILSGLYESIRTVFKNKLRSINIKNTRGIVQFIDRSREILKEEGEVADSEQDEALIL